MQEPQDHYYPSQGGDSDVHDRRQDLEREESTTLVSIIGEGYSDTISIVSDITTPTVMPGQEIPIDEYDNGPPLQIGFSANHQTEKETSATIVGESGRRTTKRNQQFYETQHSGATATTTSSAYNL
jgi:hypothetical protein